MSLFHDEIDKIKSFYDSKFKENREAMAALIDLVNELPFEFKFFTLIDRAHASTNLSILGREVPLVIQCTARENKFILYFDYSYVLGTENKQEFIQELAECLFLHHGSLEDLHAYSISKR